MQINISGHHIDLTDALIAYVKEKLGKLESHSDHINSVNVILSIEKIDKKAEATIRINGAEIFASAQESDMYAAIDSLSAKLDRQLLKHKEKSLSRKQHSR